MNIFGLGPLELLLILGLALVVFGPDKLPDIARQVGKTVAEIRKVSSEVTGEIQRGLQIEDDHRPQRPTYQAPTYQPPPAASPPPATIMPPTATPYSQHSDDVRPPY